MKFAIWAPPYQENSGGVIALHKLCHDLLTLGYDAYLITDSVNQTYRYQILHLIDDETWVIYPEIICGNPYNAKNVVRWLLNKPGVLGGNGIYEPTDLVFKYCDFFSLDDESKVNGTLRTLDADVNFWTTPLNLERKHTGMFIHKGIHKWSQSNHPVIEFPIDGYGNKHNLRGMLNQCHTLISYDHATFVSVQAAMAGCLSIVIPDGVHTAVEWRNKFPQHKYGLAYGFDESEIKWAKETLSLVPDHIRQMERDSIKSVDDFAQYCKEVLNGKI